MTSYQLFVNSEQKLISIDGVQSIAAGQVFQNPEWFICYEITN